jgi:hypothetical protein
VEPLNNSEADEGFGYHRIDLNGKIWSTFATRIKLKGESVGEDLDIIHQSLQSKHGIPIITIKVFEDEKYKNYTDEDCYEEIRKDS